MHAISSSHLTDLGMSSFPYRSRSRAMAIAKIRHLKQVDGIKPATVYKFNRAGIKMSPCYRLARIGRQAILGGITQYLDRGPTVTAGSLIRFRSPQR